MKSQIPSVSVSCFVYRWLLFAYPKSFRSRFGDEMRQVFQEQCLAHYRKHGVSAVASLWISTLFDLVKSAPGERMAAIDRWTVVWLLVGVSDGLFAAYIDFHNNEVQAAVLVILTCTFIIGAFRPRGAWRWALAVGLGVPVCHVCGKWFGLVSQYPVKPNDYASIIAVIPAFIGSYFGALLRVAACLPGDQPKLPGGEA
jgi:hypothetical protein